MNYSSRFLLNPVRLSLMLLSVVLLQLSVPATESTTFTLCSNEIRLKAPFTVVHSVINLMASAKNEFVNYKQTAEILIKQTEEKVKTWKIVKVETKKVDTTSIQWPLKGAITSKYGMRIHPVTGNKSFHNGIDIRGKKGTDVVCPTEAVVTSTGWEGALGRMVKVKTLSGHCLCFGHLSKISCKVGQKLNAGEVLGKVGSTGRATGPHLHFSVSLKGKYINPTKYLSK